MSRPLSFQIGVLLVLLSTGAAISETDSQPDPVREMLVAHFQSVQGSYRRTIKSMTLPANLGLSQKDLMSALDLLQDALTHWKIEFHPGYAAFAVQAGMHLLAVNPQIMQSILDDDDGVLLHESVHLSRSQVQRQLYGIHSELVFFEWLENNLDEEKSAKAEEKLNHMLTPDDVLRLELWSLSLKTDKAALHAAREAFRVSWICETQAYYVQMLAFDQQLKQQGDVSLKRTAEMLRKTLASETGVALDRENEVAFTLFQALNPHRVTEEFQKAVLSCVLVDTHKKLLFSTLAAASGWDMQKSQKDPAYRQQSRSVGSAKYPALEFD